MMKVGDKVTFEGCDARQKFFGNHTGSTDKLVVGEQYEVSFVEVHSWHTKVLFKDSFNSVCFKEG